ncbi:MAG: SDR family oxidoreductase [Spirochaetota bacterium]
MNLGIEGKTAVVTASSRGLGRAVADSLAAEGVNLAICARNKEQLSRTADEIKKKYKVEVFHKPCNVMNADEVESFTREVVNNFETVHILFANAGGPPAGSVDTIGIQDFEEALQLNCLSTIRLVYSFIPFMKSQKWGRIIASTSVTVKQPMENLALSNVSRAGVIPFIKGIADEYGHLNITANSLAPGYIMTDRVKDLLEDRMSREGISFEEELQQLVSRIPAGRAGKPEEFGALAAFLSSEHAGFINGTTMLIDGGMYRGIM